MSNGLPSALHPDAMCTPANAREAEIAAAAKSDATAAFPVTFKLVGTSEGNAPSSPYGY